jgi:hypothetical protein
VRPPKFAGTFKQLDFEAVPLPAISLYSLPAPVDLQKLVIEVSDLDCLMVPSLAGYKSVKWVGAVKVTKHDPVGIKSLLGQSKTGHLGLAWRQSYDIEVVPGADKIPV